MSEDQPGQVEYGKIEANKIITGKISADRITALTKDDPKRPWKALVPTVLTAVATFVGFWIADSDPFTAKEAAQGALLALGSSGITGGATYFTKNPKVLA